MANSPPKSVDMNVAIDSDMACIADALQIEVKPISFNATIAAQPEELKGMAGYLEFFQAFYLFFDVAYVVIDVYLVYLFAVRADQVVMVVVVNLVALLAVAEINSPDNAFSLHIHKLPVNGRLVDGLTLAREPAPYLKLSQGQVMLTENIGHQASGLGDTSAELF